MANAEEILENVERLIESRLKSAELQAKIKNLLDPTANAQELLRGPPTVKQRVLEFVVGVSPKVCNAAAIAEKLKLPASSVHTQLSKLFDEGIISRVGHGAYVLPNHVKHVRLG